MKESLRLHPSAPFFARKLEYNLQVGSHVLPKVNEVLWWKHFVMEIFAMRKLIKFQHEVVAKFLLLLDIFDAKYHIAGLELNYSMSKHYCMSTVEKRRKNCRDIQ